MNNRKGCKNRVLYATDLGKYYCGDSTELLSGGLKRELRGKVNLILTSPPFPLNQKKRYGNLQGEAYKRWFIGLAGCYHHLLADDGSIVIEIGNAWEPGRPVQSLLHLKALIGFVENREASLRVCQQFICYNPSRLPTPAQWVTVERIRVTDSFTHVWWMAKSDKPKARNDLVLRPYSDSMKRLIERGKYNAGLRPSEHMINEKSFLKNHGGSIVHNVMEMEQHDPRKPLRWPESMLRFANTKSSDEYHRQCRKLGLTPHPARMPSELAAFFIAFLTDPGDMVLDPFAGSNTTGHVAEQMGRRWRAIEINREYSEHSKIRFGLNPKV
jgi:site-specific DNA-methyltransferase (cytosine-N4-specific)